MANQAPRSTVRGFAPHRWRKERARGRQRKRQKSGKLPCKPGLRRSTHCSGKPPDVSYLIQEKASARVPLFKRTFEVFKMSEATTEAAVELTENAARRIAEILTREPEGSFLRIGVDGGGCW